MNDQTIMDAFSHGLDRFDPPEAMWERVEKEIALRPVHRGRRGWRRIPAVAAGIALLFSLTLAVSPGARAAAQAAAQAAVRGVVTVWSGWFGPTQVEISWGERAAMEQAVQEGTVRRIEPLTAATIEEAIEKTELIPYQPVHDTASLHWIHYYPGSEAEDTLRWIGLGYRIGNADYVVSTAAIYRWRNGTGEFEPYTYLGTTFFDDTPVENPRTVDLGSTSAICVDYRAETWCHFLVDGRQVRVSGPEETVVLELARSIRK